MTKLFLKNKNNEVFDNKVNDLLSSFKYYYNIINISQDDKQIIYNFIKNNEFNIGKYDNIINDFTTLIQYQQIIII